MQRHASDRSFCFGQKCAGISKERKRLFIFLAKLSCKITFQENRERVLQKDGARARRPLWGDEAILGTRHQININHEFTNKFINIQVTPLFSGGCGS